MLPVNQPSNDLAKPSRGCRVGLRPPRNDVVSINEGAPLTAVILIDLSHAATYHRSVGLDEPGDESQANRVYAFRICDRVVNQDTNRD